MYYNTRIMDLDASKVPSMCVCVCAYEIYFNANNIL